MMDFVVWRVITVKYVYLTIISSSNNRKQNTTKCMCRKKRRFISTLSCVHNGKNNSHNLFGLKVQSICLELYKMLRFSHLFSKRLFHSKYEMFDLCFQCFLKEEISFKCNFGFSSISLQTKEEMFSC